MAENKTICESIEEGLTEVGKAIEEVADKAVAYAKSEKGQELKNKAKAEVKKGAEALEELSDSVVKEVKSAFSTDNKQ